jgi:hypothetical protein
MELLRQRYLKHQIVRTRYADKVTFVYHRKFLKEQMITRITNTRKLIDRYSRPDVARILGKHLESLVKAELRAQHFEIKAAHTNEFQGKKWTKTDHTLDLVAEHESRHLIVGVEVKNTLSVPEREEIETKIQISKHLGLTPLFAARWMKPYVNLIYVAGGFSWFFKTQIYPLGFEKFTQTIWKRLELPVNVRTDLPKKSIEAFNAWVTKKTRGKP